MIIDQFNVFCEVEPLSASGTTNVINVPAYAGRGEVVNVTASLASTSATAGEVLLELQQGETEDGDFETISSYLVNKTENETGMASFALPYNLSKRFLRLAYTVQSGTAALLLLTAVLSRDQYAPYEKGMYVNAGKVVA